MGSTERNIKVKGEPLGERASEDVLALNLEHPVYFDIKIMLGQLLGIYIRSDLGLQRGGVSQRTKHRCEFVLLNASMFKIQDFIYSCC